MDLKQIQEKIGARYIFMEEVIATLYRAHQLQENVILWGPPGHGKSELIMGFLQLYYSQEQIFKFAFMPGMSKENLLGHVNLKALQQEGILEYDLENSFLNRDVAVFEEMFNAPPSILSMLIDIIMSKEYCVGGKMCFKSKCKMIIAATNIDPQKWVSEQNGDPQVLEAFSERFIYQSYVQWPYYTADAYSAMFEKILGQRMEVVAHMMEIADQEKKRISPRTAVKAAKGYKEFGLDGMRNIKGIDASLMQKFESIEKDKKAIAHLKEVVRDAKQIKAPGKEEKNLSVLAAAITKINNVISALALYPVPATEMAMFQTVSEISRTMEEMKQDIMQRITHQVANGGNF